jgi:hypothetical protein
MITNSETLYNLTYSFQLQTQSLEAGSQLPSSNVYSSTPSMYLLEDRKQCLGLSSNAVHRFEVQLVP